MFKLRLMVGVPYFYLCPCNSLCSHYILEFDFILLIVKEIQTFSYLTTPDVFLSTEAAKLWVTPTRLVPSTSTIWSFTLILMHKQVKASFNTLSNSPLCMYYCLCFSFKTCVAKLGTNKLTFHAYSHYFPNSTRTFLGSQISTAITPDHCLTMRQRDEAQKLGGLTRTRRPERPFPGPQHSRHFRSAQDTMRGQLSS